MRFAQESGFRSSQKVGICFTLVLIGLVFVKVHLFRTSCSSIKKSKSVYAASIQWSQHLWLAEKILKLTETRHDNRRLIQIKDFVWIGTKWDELVAKYDVCWATQSTIERIYWLPSLLEHWSGPISLAVYITSPQEWLILNLFTNYLHTCSKSISEQTSIHVAFPMNLTSLMGTEQEPQLKNVSITESIINHVSSCPNSKEYLAYLLKAFPTRNASLLALKEVYPQNHLRNIARKGCPSKWTLSVDVDILPIKHMAESLQQFYIRETRNTKTYCEKCAYVIPVFELANSVPFPSSKRQLAEYVKQGFANQFHVKTWSPGHNATNYDLWLGRNLEDFQQTEISHEILPPHRTYEPFYISPEDIPAFDERYLGYGFTRSSQFREAYLAGWRFYVITPAFMIHRGLTRNSSDLFSPKRLGVGENVRQAQILANAKLWRRVAKELQVKADYNLF